MFRHQEMLQRAREKTQTQVKTGVAVGAGLALVFAAGAIVAAVLKSNNRR